MKKVLLFALLAGLSCITLHAQKVKTFELTDLPKTWAAGTPVTEWQHDDLYVFEFWATLCGPCVKAIPHMEEMWQAVKGKGIHIVGVNVNRGEFGNQDILNFIAKQPVKPTYPMLHDATNALSDRHQIAGIPNAIVVQNGKVLWKGHPSSLTAEKLMKMRAEGINDCKTCESAKKKSVTPPPAVESKPVEKDSVIGMALSAADFPAASAWAQGAPVTQWEEGKLYLLEFWASWCGPCRAAIPHLEDLHLELKDKGVTIIGVNIDRGYDVDKILAFMERQPVPPTYSLVYGTEAEITRKINPRAIPYGVLVRDGVVVWAGHPAGLIPEKILMYRK